MATKSKSGDEDPTVDFIRDELRYEITLSRKQKRDVSVNKNRVAIGMTINNDELTEALVTELARSLKRKSLTIQDYNKLQNALIQSENHINAFFKVDNAVHGLIRDLSGTSIQAKLAAASCCCNLALGNSKACYTLSKFAAPYLVAELESTNRPLVEVCAWTIGNLVAENEKAFNIFQAQGCMKILINLSGKCSTDLLPAISYACLRYIYKEVNSIDIIEIKNLVKNITQRYSKDSDADTMWLLAILSSIPECLPSLMTCAPNICLFLVEAVLEENIHITKISAALRLVCNIVSESSGNVAHCLLDRNIEENHKFLEKLLSNQYNHIRQETLWLLGNLCNHQSTSVQQLISPIVFALPSLKLAMNSLNKIT